MRKVLIIPLLFTVSSAFCFFAWAAGSSVSVSAVVGNIIPAPVIISVSPSSNPKLLARNALQNFSVSFRDQTKSTVYYTVTAASGFVNPSSGVVTSYDSSSGATVSFLYLAPSSVPATNPTAITVTLSNGPNVVTRNINVYVY